MDIHEITSLYLLLYRDHFAAPRAGGRRRVAPHQTTWQNTLAKHLNRDGGARADRLQNRFPVAEIKPFLRRSGSRQSRDRLEGFNEKKHGPLGGDFEATRLHGLRGRSAVKDSPQN